MKPLKILLLNPPNENEIIANDAKFTREHGGFSPPLGLGYIASYLEKMTPHRIYFLDCQAEEVNYDKLCAILLCRHYDIIGITCLTLCLYDVKKTIQLIKSIKKDTLIIAGGPHATIYPEETLKLGADKVVIGEGERAMIDAISSPDTYFTQIATDYLNILPFPARVARELYYSILSDRVTTSMITSRGCPYQCNFCDRPAMGKRFRERSAVNVADEIEECLEQGIEEINMYDDTFTINRNRVFEICDEIEKRGLKFSWDIRARVNTVDYEMLKRLRKVGCIRIRMGVESGTQKVLDILNKNITLEQAENAFKWAKSAGMETFAYFMIGNPTERKEDIDETYSFSRRLKADYAQFTILTPFPATKLYTDWLAKHDTDIWEDFATNPKRDFTPPFWDEYFTLSELRDMLSKIYKAYYLQPRVLFNKIKNIRSFTQLKRCIQAGRGLWN